MIIRTATMNDLQEITAVEAACFPAAEAATKEEFSERIQYYGNHFWLMFDEQKLIAFVDGFVTDSPDLTDEMYEKANMHNEHGAWQMIFGVNTLPAYRKQGFAGQLLQRDRQCKSSGTERACTYLQRRTHSILFKIWFSK